MCPPSMLRPHRSAPRWAATGLKVTVVLTTLALLLAPRSSARAKISGCRSDPVVLLSTGVAVDLSAAIDDAATDVQQVAYTVHAPVGTSVVGWQEAGMTAGRPRRYSHT